MAAAWDAAIVRVSESVTAGPVGACRGRAGVDDLAGVDVGLGGGVGGGAGLEGRREPGLAVGS